MCWQLAPLARILGRDATAEKLLPEALELARDEEGRVRGAALAALAELADLLPLAERRARVLPCLRAAAAGGEADAGAQRALARLFGPLLTKVLSELGNDAEVGAYLATYRALAASPDAGCRAVCAGALPAVVHAATPRRYATQLHEALMALSSDAEADVRSALGAALGGVARNLGRGVAPVKAAGARAAAALLRALRRPAGRAELLVRLLRDFAHARSCWRRAAFVDMCAAALLRFSSRFCVEFLLVPALELAGDATPTVRLRAAGLLPALKRAADGAVDVAAAARAVAEEYKHAPVRMAGGGGGYLDMNGAPGTAAEAEAEDARREAEEADCVFSAEDLERIRGPPPGDDAGQSRRRASLNGAASLKRPRETQAWALRPHAASVRGGTGASEAARLAARLNRLTTEADAQLMRSRGRSGASGTPAAADAREAAPRATAPQPADARGCPPAGSSLRVAVAGRRERHSSGPAGAPVAHPGAPGGAPGARAPPPGAAQQGRPPDARQAPGTKPTAPGILPPRAAARK
ncbi:hypothetical protein WJX81_004100 [Elliptochloris bilobata]|uniref:TOG domain-containing protein n=1 Tax=Elliptochloris bilobata TaxID=381761 RepID=A0AAW1RKN5_9CHLO